MEIVKVQIDPDIILMFGEEEARYEIQRYFRRMAEHRREQGLPTVLHVAELRKL